MRKLILHTILFFLISVLVLGVLLIGSKKITRENARFRVPDSVDKIIIGNSRPEYAFNDSVISNFINISKSGESYFYSYYKLMPVLKRHEGIENVFIEFSNEQLRVDRDQATWGTMHISYGYPIYGSFIAKEGNELLFRKNFRAFINNQSVLLKNNLRIIRENAYDYTDDWGGYVYSTREKTDSILKFWKPDTIQKDPKAFSKTNIYYLEKLIMACLEEGRKVYLLRSPLHPASENLYNESFFQQLLKEKFPSIEFLDFKEFPLATIEFGNLEHLNFRGAKKFSLFFNDLLSKGLLQREDKQAMIDSLMHHW